MCDANVPVNPVKGHKGMSLAALMMAAFSFGSDGIFLLMRFL